MTQEYTRLSVNEHSASSDNNHSRTHSPKLIYQVSVAISIVLTLGGSIAVISAAIPTSLIATWLTAAGCAHLIPAIPIIHEAAHFIATGCFGAALVSDTLIAAAAATLRTTRSFYNSDSSQPFSISEEFKKHLNEAKHDIHQTVSLKEYDILHEQIDELLESQREQSETIASQETTIATLRERVNSQQSQIGSLIETNERQETTLASHGQSIAELMQAVRSMQNDFRQL